MTDHSLSETLFIISAQYSLTLKSHLTEIGLISA